MGGGGGGGWWTVGVLKSNVVVRDYSRLRNSSVKGERGQLQEGEGLCQIKKNEERRGKAGGTWVHGVGQLQGREGVKAWGEACGGRKRDIGDSIHKGAGDERKRRKRNNMNRRKLGEERDRF